MRDGEDVVIHLDVDGDRANERHDGALVGVEGVGFIGESTQSVELCLRAAGLEVLRRMMMEFIVRAIQQGDLAHRQLAQPGREFQVVTHFAEEGIPSLCKGRAVQQHAVQVQQRAAATGANGINYGFRFGKIERLIRNAGHVHLLLVMHGLALPARMLRHLSRCGRRDSLLQHRWRQPGGR